jgi:tetratricopeptide (TPR) repeat protein
MSSIDGHDPARNEVQGCLARILASEEFRNSPNLSAFLSFIVQRALEGRADTIKAYTVATQVLGRPVTFDPQADPIVRVEATRLRRALDRYYGHAGVGDPIRISIPRGTYVPVIGWRSEPDGDPPLDELIEPSSTVGAALSPDRGGRRLAVGLAASVMVAATAAGAGYVLRAGAPARTEAPPVLAMARDATPSRAREGTSLTTFATLLIPPLAEGSAGARAYAVLLTDLLRSGLARFDDVAIIESPAEQPGGRGSTDDTYSLLGRVSRVGNEHRIAMRLRHEISRQIVWSAEYVVPEARGNEGEELRLMRQIAATLVSPGGILARDTASAKAAADPKTVPAACIVLTDAALGRGDPVMMREARDCLGRAASDYPRFAPVRAMLARLAVEEWRTALSPDPLLLDAALRDAQASVALAPQVARNHAALSDVLAARGDRAGAEEAARRAQELNPYSAEVAATLAFRDIEAGRYPEGVAALADLQQAGTGATPWQAFFSTLASMGVGAAVPKAADAGLADLHPSETLAVLLSGQGHAPAALRAAVVDARRRIPAAVADPVEFAQRLGLQPDMAEQVGRRLGAALASG